LLRAGVQWIVFDPPVHVFLHHRALLVLVGVFVFRVKLARRFVLLEQLDLAIPKLLESRFRRLLGLVKLVEPRLDVWPKMRIRAVVIALARENRPEDARPFAIAELVFDRKEKLGGIVELALLF